MNRGEGRRHQLVEALARPFVSETRGPEWFVLTSDNELGTKFACGGSPNPGKLVKIDPAKLCSSVSNVVGR